MPYYLTHFIITINFLKFIFFKTLHFKNKQDYKRENNIVIMFQNVKKFKRNINIIKEDRGFKAADVLIFVQTSSLDADKLIIFT